MNDMTIEASTAYLAMPIIPTGEEEKALAVMAIARSSETNHEFFELLAMMGLDDDPRMIEQAMELRLSKVAARPSDISSMMI